MPRKRKETVLFFCAHNDDQIIGAGGTLAKYAREGKYIVTVILAFGEGSHPWLQKREIIVQRVRESKKADRILGGKELMYFGLQEGKFREDAKKKNIKAKVTRLIQGRRPSKIFTHSIDDPHPDHKAAYYLLEEALKQLDYAPEVYTFSVWNPITIRKRNYPKLFVDISKTFPIKIKALMAHESQKIAVFTLLWNIYRTAILNGLKHGCKYAEMFIRIK
ncbi:PIG-L family deacetylase [Candidatus Woesearchaeota archaeon]|nr:PIG-L family deacetylase [Candidatus Woesearchaeota archaeon]